MKIEKNAYVSLAYQLRSNGLDGELIEETTKENPLNFVYGTGRMLEMFEYQLAGLKAGDKFNFELKAVDAYGEVSEDAVVDLPRDIFEINGAIDEDMLSVGNSVPMQDAQGNRLNGIVLEMNDDTVKMDFNHPLAGDNLLFSGYIIDVREATEEELMEAVGSNSCGTGSCCSSCSC